MISLHELQSKVNEFRAEIERLESRTEEDDDLLSIQTDIEHLKDKIKLLEWVWGGEL